MDPLSSHYSYAQYANNHPTYVMPQVEQTIIPPAGSKMAKYKTSL